MFKQLGYTLIVLLFLAPFCLAGDIKAIKTNESFQEVARIDQLEQIKINTMPRTTYTPTNLRTQYEMRFQGRNTSTGAMTIWSNTFTDYDTKIMNSQLEGNDYYLYDNAGQKFKTGEHVDLTPIQQSIYANTQRLNAFDQDLTNFDNQIQVTNQRMDGFRKDLANFNNRINDLETEMYSGLATVTALTSLHPNPRSTAPVELSLGTGIYRDQCAGAVGLFVHPNNNSMLQGGAAFGNDNNWAGYLGVTFNLPQIRIKKLAR